MKIGLRTVLAKTCTNCGAFKQRREFKTAWRHGRGYVDAWCLTCQQASSNRITRTTNAKSLDTATKHRQEWTSSEMKQLSELLEKNTPRGDIAKQLGRSINAISNRIKFMKEN